MTSSDEYWDAQLRRAAIEVMGSEPHDSCRHCACGLWLVRTGKSQSPTWVNYLGVQSTTHEPILSRFCAKLEPRRQHAPIPTKLKKLNAWLNSE